jgi:hypothetical protein
MYGENMNKNIKSTVSFTCRVRVDVMEQIRESALQQKISQSAVITKALECMVNEHTSEIPIEDQSINLIEDLGKQLKALECMVNEHTSKIPTEDQSINRIEDLSRQLSEKDELISKLVGNQTELIRQNDQSQQLIGAFSRREEGSRLLEQIPVKQKKHKQGKEVDRTSYKEGSITKKDKKKPKKWKKKK